MIGTEMLRDPSGIVRLVVTAALAMIAVVALYPLLFTILNSFKTRTGFAKNPLGLTSQLTFDNYIETFNRMAVPRLFLNSVIATAGGSTVTFTVSVAVTLVTHRVW